MIFARRLKRKKLIRVIRNFWKKYKSLEDRKDKIKIIYRYLVKLEKILNKYSCEKDDRFVTYGRRDFLRNEFLLSLNEKDESNYDYLNVAFGDLYDYIMCDTWITKSSVTEKESLENIIKEDNAYRDEGLICIQEKEILLDRICKFKDEIKIMYEEMI